MRLSALERFCKPYYAAKDCMHGLEHVKRVHARARELMAGRAADPRIVACACHFHGIIKQHEPQIRAWLLSQRVSPDAVERIVLCAHEAHKDREPSTMEGVLVHDAHLLEGGDSFLLVKCLLTGASRGQSLQQTIRFMERHILGKHRCCLPAAQRRYARKERFARRVIADLQNHL